MPAIPGLRVVSSRIHGYGVVATRDFAPGEVVAEVDGLLWHEDVSPDHDDGFSLWLGDGFYLDMLDQTRWINHSCAPNAEVFADLAPAPWARLVAIQPIRAGEEITYDYGFTAELAEPCRCGAERCRRFIVDAEELPRLLEKHGRSAA